MLRKRLKNPIFLIYLLVVYVILQFSWWLYLIFSLYKKTYIDQTILEQKKWMLFGEGSVFIFILLLGVVFILRAFKSERELARQQENFVLSITHELKTPISSVKLYLQTLQKRELDASKRGEIYDRSLTEINRLDGLVSNLLLTRSIENATFFMNKQPIELAAFIQSKVELLQKSILRDHTVELDLTPITFPVDTIGFESILINLLENAAKYSAKKSTVYIKLIENKDFITLLICDEGIGIDKAKREKVFSKFYREENEMTRKSKGTGLGLFITKYLVEQHNGQIHLEDNLPKGLKVSIQLKK